MIVAKFCVDVIHVEQKVISSIKKLKAVWQSWLMLAPFVLEMRDKNLRIDRIFSYPVCAGIEFKSVYMYAY